MQLPTLRQVNAALARLSLDEWQCFLDPDHPPPRHARLLNRALEDVEQGKIRRLMIFLPPGHAKSSYASINFPAWYLGRNPAKTIIGCSHTDDLATAFGRRVRNIVKADEFSEVFGFGIDPGSTSAGDWAVDSPGRKPGQLAGAYKAAGIGGSITGRRADCVLGSTIVLTEHGYKRIDEVVNGSSSCIVLSYDERTGQAQYSRIIATAKREAAEFYRVRTTAGRVVEVTGNHRIHTQNGYVQASSVSTGDRLLCAMWEGRNQASVCDEEVDPSREQAHILLTELQHTAREPGTRDGGSFLQGVRDTNSHEEQAHKPILLGRLQENSNSAERKEANRGAGACLRVLRGDVQAGQPETAGAILLKDVQGQGARLADDGRSESVLAGRREPFACSEAFSKGIQADKAGHIGEGRSCVRGVRIEPQAACAPHQHERFGQPLDEPCDAVREAPSHVARSGEIETEVDTVDVVERVCESAEVYDIQVEGTECFFADGILVHNCGLIDDPLKSREDAESKTIRAKQWEWYKSDFRTRLKPGAAIIIIQTRWHMDDLSGRILPEDYDGRTGKITARDGEVWHVLSMPAVIETAHQAKHDPLKRQIGDALWPEWYSAEHLRQEKISQGPRNWSALFQQHPVPDAGGYFQRDWFKWYDTAPSKMAVVGMSDYAVTKDGGDYTEHGVFGIDQDNRIHVLDWWSGQTTPEVWIDAKLDLVDKWKTSLWVGESGVIRRSIEGLLMRRMQERNVWTRMEWLAPIGDKEARARGFQARASGGFVLLPNGKAWATDLHEQLLMFPAGVYDDKVDVCSLLGRALDMAGFVSTPVERKREGPKPFTEAWLESGDDPIKGARFR